VRRRDNVNNPINVKSHTEILSSLKNKKKIELTSLEEKILRDVNWDIKSKGMWGMYLRREYLFDGIFLTTYGNRTILVSQLCGGVFRYKNDVDRMIIEGKRIKLQKIRRPWEERVVYENGEFQPTLGEWLMESRQLTGGDGEYKCFTLKKNGEFDEMIIRDHQMHVLMAYGAIALTAIGNEDSGRKKCVNHKNGVKFDNRPSNLEVILTKDNIKHYYQELKEYDAIINVNGKLIVNPKLNNKF
jgi:hypothetical protein